MNKFNTISNSPLSSGHLLARIASEVGTPVWVYDAQIVEKQISLLQEFDIIRYAQKANSNLSILQIMKRNGVRIDAVSIGEIDRALLAGYSASNDADDLVYTADIVTEDALRRIAELGIPLNCGSQDMISQIAEISPGHPIWLRINPGFGSGHSNKTNTGGPNSKHGIWHDLLGECLDLLNNANVELVGLHMHIGSGADYHHLEQVCVSMVKVAEAIDRPIKAISAGGGLSVQYRTNDRIVDTERYFKLWDSARKRIEKICGNELNLEIEPGRFLVANSGKLVCQVRAVKKVADRLFVIVDAGFNDLMRPTMYGSYHNVWFADTDGETVQGREEPIIIAGPLCEAGDVFSQQEGGNIRPHICPVPKVGDYAIFDDVGAYGSSMSSNYNTRPLSCEVLLDEGKVTVIRRRQELSELLSLETQPQTLDCDDIIGRLQ